MGALAWLSSSPFFDQSPGWRRRVRFSQHREMNSHLVLVVSQAPHTQPHGINSPSGSPSRLFGPRLDSRTMLVHRLPAPQPQPQGIRRPGGAPSRGFPVRQFSTNRLVGGGGSLRAHREMNSHLVLGEPSASHPTTRHQRTARPPNQSVWSADRLANNVGTPSAST